MRPRTATKDHQYHVLPCHLFGSRNEEKWEAAEVQQHVSPDKVWLRVRHHQGTAIGEGFADSSPQSHQFWWLFLYMECPTLSAIANATPDQWRLSISHYACFEAKGTRCQHQGWDEACQGMYILFYSLHIRVTWLHRRVKRSTTTLVLRCQMAHWILIQAAMIARTNNVQRRNTRKYHSRFANDTSTYTNDLQKKAKGGKKVLKETTLNSDLQEKIKLLRDRWECSKSGCGGSHCYISPENSEHQPLSHQQFSIWASAWVRAIFSQFYLFTIKHH